MAAATLSEDSVLRTPISAPMVRSSTLAATPAGGSSVRTSR